MPYAISIINLPSGTRCLRANASGDITGTDVDLLYTHEAVMAGMPMLIVTHEVRNYDSEARKQLAKYSARENQPWAAAVISSQMVSALGTLIKRVNHATKFKSFSTETEAIQWLEERVREDAAPRGKG